ncbi:prepilin-type N-terminal cleavage/methylation domain-containing protein [Solibacillus sp. FSL K6-1554]|uniref:prepilin-type N-terminal cleavage/methylation domain-containing protein n=1 Tax=Solibacillus sp. FSL K6-1554 TaxID=2921472 RepID=UPI0030F7DC8F
MFNTLKKRIKNEKGLSLVELLAVIVILAIVAAIAIPAIGNIVANSRAKAEISDAIQVLNAANIYFTDNPTATVFTNTAGEGTTATADYLDYIEINDESDTFTVDKANNPLEVNYQGDYLKSSYTRAELTALKVEGGEIVGQSTEGGEN